MLATELFFTKKKIAFFIIIIIIKLFSLWQRQRIKTFSPEFGFYEYNESNLFIFSFLKLFTAY